MGTDQPPAHQHGLVWRAAPFPNSPRPWLPAVLTLATAALVIAGSLGPWLYVEEGPDWDITTRSVPGAGTDGVFSLFFATIAAVAVLITLVWPRLWGLAWVAVVAMILCSMVGLFDWVIFDPMDLATQPGRRASLIQVEWGLKVVTFAAPIGVLCAWWLARRLMHGDY